MRRRCSPVICFYVSALWRIAGLEMRAYQPVRGDVGGYKEVVATMRGKGAFAALKFESGFTVFSACPKPKAAGDSHSAATVAVLPDRRSGH